MPIVDDEWMYMIDIVLVHSSERLVLCLDDKHLYNVTQQVLYRLWKPKAPKAQFILLKLKNQRIKQQRLSTFNCTGF